MAALKTITGFRCVAINNRASCTKVLNSYCLQSYFSSKLETPVKTPDESAKKKKTTPIPKITLVFSDESIQVLTFEEAQKLSKRRDLKLVKILDLDTKTQRPIYKLMTGAEYHVEDLKQREAKKEKRNETIRGEKLLLLNAKISEHDIESRIKNIVKWITKKYEIRVVINGDASNMEPSEKLYNIIEDRIKTDGRLLQKRVKGNELKFQILPPKMVRQKSDQAGNQHNANGANS